MQMSQLAEMHLSQQAIFTETWYSSYMTTTKGDVVSHFVLIYFDSVKTPITLFSLVGRFPFAF